MSAVAQSKMKKTLILACILGLSACSYFPERVKSGKPQLVAEPESVTVMLADAADRATRALETLATVEQVRSGVPRVATIPNAPRELKRGVTVEWNGPAEAMIKALSAKTGYSYKEFGSRPPVPMVVNVKATNRPAIEVFRDIGLQLGARANLKVDANRRAVELFYSPVGGSTLSGG